MQLLATKPGDVFDRAAVSRTTEAIRSFVAAKGRDHVAVAADVATDVAKKGDAVRVMFKGTLADGTVFDESRLPFDFTLGDSTIIRGFDLGVTGMKVGERRRVTIPRRSRTASRERSRRSRSERRSCTRSI